jgi:hypothetical protein
MMEAVRERWTDARMDDLSCKVDELGRRMDNGFNRVDADIRALRDETKAEFGVVRKEMRSEFATVRGEIKYGSAALREEMKAESAAFRSETRAESAAFRGEVNERFEGMQERLDAIQRMMLWFCGLAMTALLGLVAALLGVVVGT